MIGFCIEHIGRLDSRLCIRVSRLQRWKFLNRIMYFFSRIGDGFIYPFIAVPVLIFDVSAALRLIAASLIAFLIEISSYKVLKNKIKRIRPFESIMEISSLVKPPDKFSFPSGHTAAGFVIATILSAFYPYLSIPSYTNASLIGFSRIYNGVHYPGDVLAGAFMGIVSGHIGLIVM